MKAITKGQTLGDDWLHQQFKARLGVGVGRHPLGWTRADHLKMLLFFLLFFGVVAAVVSYNLALLHTFRPDYGRDQDEAVQRAFCAEWDEKVWSTIYYWDEDERVCRALDSRLAQGNY